MIGAGKYACDTRKLVSKDSDAGAQNPEYLVHLDAICRDPIMSALPNWENLSQRVALSVSWMEER